jgi:hypothetical protein
LRCIKIGEPNINSADIPLNPTYYIRKGSEVDTPLSYYLFSHEEGHMEEGIIDRFQKQREELNQRRAIQAWHELKQKDK